MKAKDLIEMAVPTADMAAKTWYHGTETKEAADGIMREGIKPKDVVVVRSRLQTPVRGKVYMTDRVEFAAIYAMGGVYFEQEYLKNMEPGLKSGYVFVIPGANLVDVQPDEDSVGEALYAILNDSPEHPFDMQFVSSPREREFLKGALGPGVRYQLLNLAQRYATPNQLRRIKGGEYAYYAAGGKRIVAHMDDRLKLKLIELGANVAHTGVIQPSECWALDMYDTKVLKKDGSNFFQVAKRIWTSS